MQIAPRIYIDFFFPNIFKMHKQLCSWFWKNSTNCPILFIHHPAGFRVTTALTTRWTLRNLSLKKLRNLCVFSYFISKYRLIKCYCFGSVEAWGSLSNVLCRQSTSLLLLCCDKTWPRVTWRRKDFFFHPLLSSGSLISKEANAEPGSKNTSRVYGWIPSPGSLSSSPEDPFLLQSRSAGPRDGTARERLGSPVSISGQENARVHRTINWKQFFIEVPPPRSVMLQTQLTGTANGDPTSFIPKALQLRLCITISSPICF